MVKKKRSHDTFAFVHVSHPDGFKDKGTQNKIRRHAMGAAGQLRLKPRRNPTIPVDIPPNMTDITNHTQQWSFERSQKHVMPHIPFLGIYPVEISNRARQLIHFIVQVAGNLHFIPFRYESYSLSIADLTAFYLYLANAAFLHNHLTQQENSTESNKYLAICLSQVITRVENEAPRVSPGLIYTMLGLACHEVCCVAFVPRGCRLHAKLLKTHLGNWDRRAVHLDGLERAVKARGGLENIDHTIALLIFWFDVAESSSRDCVPRYAVPKHLKVKPPHKVAISSRLSSIIERLTQSGNCEIAEALKEFGILMESIAHISHDDELWKSSLKGASLLTPISHSLLSMPKEMIGRDDTSSDYSVEMTRITLLIILARLKQTFSFPSDELIYFRERFTTLLILHSGSDVLDLELWCVVHVALIDWTHMGAYVSRIDTLSKILGVEGPEQTFEIVRNIIPVDGLLSLDIAALSLRLNTP
ncbi:unnamed protein product [Clonostachys rosea]|uniref:Transcription factor domain-containing protein n=1 Tax=Bionectria ochroleuca TaxID=29856 RepID=A0ABY6V110_BIOOC|nr:unnamed protein product [Clonostachys rosea]